MADQPASTVFVVDDDEAIRDALEFLLRSRRLAVETFGSGEAFLAGVGPERAGCLILDVRMPGMTGPELYDRLRSGGYCLPVVFLTGHGDVPMAVGALRKGAYHFIEKPFSDNELVDLVGECMELDVRQRAGQRERQALEEQLAGLTVREREVMDLILAGKLNKVIADELSISLRTVEVHRSRILEKMGVRSAVELAQRMKMLDPGA